MTANTPLAEKLKARIAEQGAMPIADFMRVALTDPEHGYYTRRDAFIGDFITAPEISPIFGELVGIWLVDYWQRIGAPKRIALAELGAGRGQLMQDAHRAIAKLHAKGKVEDFLNATQVHFVEISPPLRAEQKTRIPNAQTHNTITELLDAIGNAPLFVIANEFFDALPIRQFIANGTTPTERHVGLSDGALAFTPIADDADIIETCPEAENIMTLLARHIAKAGGVMLVIDYGYTEDATGATLQAIHKHSYCDPLAHIGNADLTSHVNFARLAQVARQAGASAFAPITQSAFLHAMGSKHRAAQLAKAHPTRAGAIWRGHDRLTAGDQMGRLFKALCIAQNAHPAPNGFSARL